MKVIKDKKLVTKEYIEKLKIWLLENKKEYFMDDNRADSLSDFERFLTLKTDREHLCMPTEPMLVDRSHDGVHMFCICTISKNNRITSQIPVIATDELKNFWKCGYFLLPTLDDN